MTGTEMAGMVMAGTGMAGTEMTGMEIMETMEIMVTEGTKAKMVMAGTETMEITATAGTGIMEITVMAGTETMGTGEAKAVRAITEGLGREKDPIGTMREAMTMRTSQATRSNEILPTSKIPPRRK